MEWVVLKLNCDMGESYGAWQMGLDEAVMPHIDMASIACGFHASDPDVMAKTIQLACKYQVTIGAHPGYHDKKGFGRRHVPHTITEIKHLVSYQVGALQALCQLVGAKVDYVKPHGALYHDMMNDLAVFEAIVASIHQLDAKLSLVLLASSNREKYQKIADQYQLQLQYEAFADRQYSMTGDLLARTDANAIHQDEQQIINQVNQLAQGYVENIDGDKLAIMADTICVHGDNPASVKLIKLIKQQLQNAISN